MGRSGPFALLILLPLLSLLGGCAGDDRQPRPMHVVSRVEDRRVELEVWNIPPGREITALVLIDPAGNETLARNRELITREEGSRGGGTGVGVGATGGSSSGVNPFISLGYVFGGQETVRRSQRMTAEIPLAAPQSYAAGYRDWRVAVRYRDQLGEPQQISIPAPAP